jgi:hypothetical protein
MNSSSLSSSNSSLNKHDSTTNQKYIESDAFYNSTHPQQFKIATINVNEPVHVKVDSSSCVLPSKLKQRSQSLAEETQRSQPIKNAVSYANGVFKQPQLQQQQRCTPARISASSAKESLLRWCRQMTENYDNISIKNFSSSWSNGLAFCALMHHFMPDAFDYSKLDGSNPRYNFDLAFRIAE